MDNLFIFDIETLKAEFLLGLKRVSKEERYWFEISAYRNDLYKMIKFLLEEPIDYSIGFNNVNFDFQVLQFILDNYHKWYDLSNLEIVAIIYNFSQEIISNQNYDILPPYKDGNFSIPQIDLFKILGYDNENKRTSLKWVEFGVDAIIEEMPIHHSQETLTLEETIIVRDYCNNDLIATEILYNYIRGNCDHPEYKGRDKIQERLDCIQEFGLPTRAMNFSDVKLGETINLNGYMQLAGIRNISELYERKKNRKHKRFNYGDCIPKYVSFTTGELQDFHKRIKKVEVAVNSKQEFPVTFGGLTYMIAKGGIHSENSPAIIEEDKDNLIIEFDCGSQYPSSIVKRGLYPAHLGKEWLVNYKKLIQTRLEAKERGKTDNKYKGIAETFKLSVNGGGFGMTNSTFSVQYDPFVHFQCTIGNQFEILMLIEWLTLEGIDILSANTDGALCRVPRVKEKLFLQKCKEWESLVGNTEIGQLEYTYYKKYVMITVNDYIAQKADGKLKQKGDLLVDFLLEKNKSKRIVPIALQKYFIEGIPVEETIKNHTNIFDFCIAKKSSSDYFYRGVDRKTGNVNNYNKLIRYYVSQTGEKIYKIKHEHSLKTGPKQSECQADWPYQTIYNTPFTTEDFKVNHDFYIQQCKKIIYQVQPELKRIEKDQKSGQISLF